MCLLQNWKRLVIQALAVNAFSRISFFFYQKTSFQSRSYLVAIIKSYSIFVCWQNRLGSERATKVLRILLFVPITRFEYFDILPKFLSYSCQEWKRSTQKLHARIARIVTHGVDGWSHFEEMGGAGLFLGFLLSQLLILSCIYISQQIFEPTQTAT